jgi:hypothetical protein
LRLIETDWNYGILVWFGLQMRELMKIYSNEKQLWAGEILLEFRKWHRITSEKPKIFIEIENPKELLRFCAQFMS